MTTLARTEGALIADHARVENNRPFRAARIVACPAWEYSHARNETMKLRVEHPVRTEPAREAAPAERPSPRPPREPALDQLVNLRVAYLATQGDGSGDEGRIGELLAPLNPTRLRFDRSRKARSGAAALTGIVRNRPDIVVMEGTGVAGGAAVVAARVLAGVPYVVSSGDAVGPYLGLISAWLSTPGRVYERLLCRLSAGYIGWSPYLVGRAITLGARRGMTAANWSSEEPLGEKERHDRRTHTRQRLGIPETALVVGLVGSLKWNQRRGYAYGLELVDALRRTTRDDLRVLIVGDGTGRQSLQARAGGDNRVLLPGAVPHSEIPSMLAAMDVASLPQSLDEVGALRYTTKLTEYLAARVPVVTGQLPLAYDLDDGWLWRIAGAAPWDPQYIAALAHFLELLDRDDVAARGARIPRRPRAFEFARQQRAVTAFVSDAACAARGTPPVPRSEEGL
jgi:glycosyltransferase involved in cell wall biosynthesis